MLQPHPEGAEKARLRVEREGKAAWKKWGPYVSERQWGTVREDYSQDGDAWSYFTHDQARSRVYRWGEDGLAGISDEHQLLCFALALWNGRDPILKERAFGLTNAEGNHGEDVKDCYYYLDNTPTHSYMKYLYKYPQSAFPYLDLVETNRKRGRHEREYELVDTGIFDRDRYFDVLVEYAKGSPEDMLVRVSVCNRAAESALLHVLPTLWFRNTWSWQGGSSRPMLWRLDLGRHSAVSACHTDPLFRELLPDCYLFCEGEVPLLFTENETNASRLFGTPNRSPYVKDGINDYVVHRRMDAVNPAQAGTKVAAHYVLTVGPSQSHTIRLRLTRAASGVSGNPFEQFDEIFEKRVREADEFYDSITPQSVSAASDRARVMRQALAGMLWNKQYYYYDVRTWLKEHNIVPESTRVERRGVRNGNWSHMVNDDVFSMPDKWEYPWYAAWDLAFHTLPLVSVDPDFAKSQLSVLLRNEYLHPNGQMPAYEWDFGAVNPPVHAYAAMQIYLQDKEMQGGKGDLDFLKTAFDKLLVNYTWWANRRDRDGNNLYEGGFLGVDNVGVFDRSAPLPTGGHLEQAEGTAWMIFLSQEMLRIAVELASHEPRYEQLASRFAESTMWLAGSMDHIGGRNGKMWDDEDGFFYDVLRLPDGTSMRLKVRSMVGLLPLAAVAIFEDETLGRLPAFRKRATRFLASHPDLAAGIHMPASPGVGGRRMLSILNEDKLKRILSRMLDEKEFFSPHGIRSLSRYHLDQPFVFSHVGQEIVVSYLPAESDSGMFGGNSNWRGSVWMPVNFMLYTALLRLGEYYGDSLVVECPTGSGRRMNLTSVAHELGERLISTFERDAAGRRPVFGGIEKFQTDPHWRDHVLFGEYLHGDTGAGIGASHQTGWTGCVARIIQMNGLI
jgi:hypothetical protein